MVFERYDDWYGQKEGPLFRGGLPQIRRAVRIPVLEEAARIATLETGVAQTVYEPPTDRIEEFQGNSDYQVITAPTRARYYISMQYDVEPWGDVRVRMAFAHAINNKAIVEEITGGAILPGRGALSPAFGIWFNEDIQPYEYNPEKSRQLLADAGLADGFTAKFVYPSSGKQMPKISEIGTFIQSEVAKVGITLDVEVREFSAFIMDHYFGKLPMSMASTMSSVADPGHSMSSTFRCGQTFNMSHYCNEEYDSIYVDYLVEPDVAKRKERFDYAQQLLYDEVAWYVFGNIIVFLVADADIEGIVVYPQGHYYYSDLRWK